jgi:hypothetical protein
MGFSLKFLRARNQPVTTAIGNEIKAHSKATLSEMIKADNSASDSPINSNVLNWF